MIKIPKNIYVYLILLTIVLLIGLLTYNEVQYSSFSQNAIARESLTSGREQTQNTPHCDTPRSLPISSDIFYKKGVNITLIKEALDKIPSELFDNVETISFLTKNGTLPTDKGRRVANVNIKVYHFRNSRVMLWVEWANIEIYNEAYNSKIPLECNIAHELGHINELIRTRIYCDEKCANEYAKEIIPYCDMSNILLDGER